MGLVSFIHLAGRSLRRQLDPLCGCHGDDAHCFQGQMNGDMSVHCPTNQLNGQPATHPASQVSLQNHCPTYSFSCTVEPRYKAVGYNKTLL